MNTDYEHLRSIIQSLNLNLKRTFDVICEINTSDIRMSSIKALISTESIYLERIVDLLTDIFTEFDKGYSNIFRNPIANKGDVTYLLYYFPIIYNLHVSLHKEFTEDLNLLDNIGNVMFEFLGKSKVLDVYENYVARVSKCLLIAKTIEGKSSEIPAVVKDLSNIIINPVQRFPQLSLSLNDIYKHTPDGHVDKVNLFKSASISRSICSRLNRRRRNCEHRDFKDIYWLVTKLKLGFSSTKLLVNNSVFELKFLTDEKVIKIPYKLMLCDRNVIMLPKNLRQFGHAAKIVSCFPVSAVDFEQYTFPKLNCQISENKSNQFSDIRFVNLKNLYRASKHCRDVDESLLIEYEKMFNDFSFLFNINTDLKKLHFSYSEVKQSITKSLLELEPKLKEKEHEITIQMSSLVVLNYKASNTINKTKYILFDSSKQANDWIISFNRAKLLSDIQLETDWLYYSAGSNFEQLSDSELPLVYQPFSINQISNDTQEFVIVKCLSVNVVLGINVCRCLWITLTSGWILILHFDYRQWQLLERFKVDTNQPISELCEVTELDPHSKHLVTSEMWMASGNWVFIYSLINNRNSDIKTSFKCPSTITSLCKVNDKILVGLQSNIIHVYHRSHGLTWTKDYEISLVSFQRFNDEIIDIVLGNNIVYVIYNRTVIILDNSDENCLKIKNKFEVEKGIKALSPTSEAVWIAFANQNSIVLYDKYINHIYQTINLPLNFLYFPSLGNITCIYNNENYIWLGTENGFIIAIAVIDSSYCINTDIPMYYSVRYSTGPITQLIPFENVRSILPHSMIVQDFERHFQNKNTESSSSDNSLAYSSRDADSDANISRDETDALRDLSSDIGNKVEEPQYPSIDSMTLEEYIEVAYSLNDLPDDSPLDETDSLSDQTLQNVYKNLKNSTLTLLLAIGTGISKYCDKKLNSAAQFDPNITCDKKSTIFTFLE